MFKPYREDEITVREVILANLALLISMFIKSRKLSTRMMKLCLVVDSNNQDGDA